MASEPTPQQLYEIAVADHQAGRFGNAEAAYQRALALDPSFAQGWNDLGILYLDMQRIGDGIAMYRRALAVRPNMVEAHVNLAAALLQTGDIDQAIESCRRAIVLNDRFAPGYNLLGNACYFSCRLEEAIAAYSRALEIEPNLIDALNNLGLALHEAGRLDEAAAALRRALALRPGFAESARNLGDVLRSAGDVDGAVAIMRDALASRPNPRLASNLLFTLHFHPDYDRRRIFDEHARWAETYARPLRSQILPHANDRSPDRRLRIGYSASTLGNHPQGRLLLPLLANHDHDSFEIFCYCHGRRDDYIARQLHDSADVWRQTVGMSDEQLVAQIRDDRIDILVDLAMHTGANRMLLFARKPAPIQICYLGYCSTTGLDTIDYRFTDPYLDPPGLDDSVYAEKSLRLRSYWCYPPPREAPAISTLSAAKSGDFTFGCLNEFSKVTGRQLSLWAQVLACVPNSRLILHTREGSHRGRVLDQLARDGVAPQRVRFVGYVPMEEYFATYNRIDLALDTFPYAGGTTTLDALWMGLPVVSLVGETAVSRAGLSILSNIGLPELAATTQEQYVERAAALARDLPRLVDLRASLRERMRRSTLMDAQGFARNVETAYRQMWKEFVLHG